MAPRGACRIVLLIWLLPPAFLADSSENESRQVPDTANAHGGHSRGEAISAVHSALLKVAAPGDPGDEALHTLKHAHAALDAEGTAAASALSALLLLFGLPGAEAGSPDLVSSPRDLPRALEKLAAITGQLNFEGKSEPFDGDAALYFSLCAYLIASGHADTMEAATIEVEDQKAIFGLSPETLRFARAKLANEREPTQEIPQDSDRLLHWDMPAMTYFLGAKAGDVFGALAFTFYSMHGISHGVAGLVDPANHVPRGPSLPREPRPVDEVDKGGPASSSFVSRCRDAVNVLWPHAVHSVSASDNKQTDLASMYHTVELRLPVVDRAAAARTERYQDRRDVAEFVRGQARWTGDGDALAQWGLIAHEGNYKLGQAPNHTEAREVWADAAKNGHPGAALAMLILHVDGDPLGGTLEDATRNAQLVIAHKEAPDHQKAYAQYIKYRLGLGVTAKPHLAWEWLLRSADAGNGNAMMAVAEAYAGLRVPSNVTMPEEATHIQEATFEITRDEQGGAGYIIASTVVAGVEEGSPAALAGMSLEHVGWSITHVDEQKVTDDNITAALAVTRQPGRTFALCLRREQGGPVRDNDKAFHYWGRAAHEHGRATALMNIAGRMMKGEALTNISAGERCMRAHELVRGVALQRHPLVAAAHALARRAYDAGDLPGSLLWYSFLSEAGSKVAARNAADLWTTASSFTPVLPCFGSGASVAPNGDCALFHLRRAAALGDLEAMSKVAVEENRRGRAAVGYAWADRAARRGDLRGLYERAVLEAEGYGSGNTTHAVLELRDLLANGDAPTRVAALFALARMQAFWLAGTWSAEWLPTSGKGSSEWLSARGTGITLAVTVCVATMVLKCS